MLHGAKAPFLTYIRNKKINTNIGNQKANKTKQQISMIYAYNKVGGNLLFGNGYSLPWKIKEDLENFKRITLTSTIIMGAKTFQSLPSKLPHRKHVVLSTRDEKVLCKSGESPDEQILIDDYSLKSISEIDMSSYGKVFFIGGSELLNTVKHIVNKVYVTVICGHYLGDVYLDKSLAHDSEFMSQFKKKFVLGNEVIFYELS